MVCFDGREVPVVFRFGHAWFFLDRYQPLASVCFLSELELRRLHQRFGHPSVRRLHKLLLRAGHEALVDTLEEIRKMCHHC